MKKLTIEYVKKEALKLGRWEIIDIVYRGSGIKLKCKCLKCGVHTKISWDNIKQNKGCVNCNRLAYVPKISIQKIRKSFEKEGYTLLTKTYKNNTQKLKYICFKGHRHAITWGNWNFNKRRCPYCYGNARLTLEYVKSLFAKEGYEVIGGYKNNYTPIKYRCPIGHEHSVRLDCWKGGDRCPYCSPGKVKRKLTTEIVRAELAKEGYILLSEYVNNRTKFSYQCKRGHNHTMTYGSWYMGRRCPDCVPCYTSRFEKEVKKYVKSKNISFVPNDRATIMNDKTGCNLELDLWFPQLNKAIECDGSYWHQDEMSVYRDKVKTEKCKRLGISLLRIDYKNWTNQQEKCQATILSFLGANNKL